MHCKINAYLKSSLLSNMLYSSVVTETELDNALRNTLCLLLPSGSAPFHQQDTPLCFAEGKHPLQSREDHNKHNLWTATFSSASSSLFLYFPDQDFQSLSRSIHSVLSTYTAALSCATLCIAQTFLLGSTSFSSEHLL